MSLPLGWTIAVCDVQMLVQNAAAELLTSSGDPYKSQGHWMTFVIISKTDMRENLQSVRSKNFLRHVK